MRLPLAALLLLWLLPAQGQNWYQVEIIVFSQSHPDLFSQSASEEQWPDSFHPDWPSPLVRLNSPESVSPALRPLSASSRALNADAADLRFASGYELLWHQAWLQPMLNESESPWIQVQAGADSSGRYVLEGALRVYLERFLHLDSDLWLSQFSAVEEVFPEDVEATIETPFGLPESRLAIPACAYYIEKWPPGVAMEVPQLEPGTLLENWWFPPFDCSIEAIELPAGLPLGKALNPYLQVELPSIRFEVAKGLEAGPVEIHEARPLFIDNSPAPLAGTEDILDRSWQISQIIPLRQSRRMRSGEVHYLDHPRLGILALITPVEAPVIAQTEQPGPP